MQTAVDEDRQFVLDTLWYSPPKTGRKKVALCSRTSNALGVLEPWERESFLQPSICDSEVNLDKPFFSGHYKIILRDDRST